MRAFPDLYEMLLGGTSPYFVRQFAMGDHLFSEYNAVFNSSFMRLCRKQITVDRCANALIHGRVFVDVGFQAMRALTNLPLCDPVGCHCV